MKKYIVFTVLFLIKNLCLSAQQNDSLTQKLDEYLISANKFYKFNGTALVAQKGKILLDKSYGYKNFTLRTLNDTNTIFQIGSVTKQFTATVILKLQ